MIMAHSNMALSGREIDAGLLRKEGTMEGGLKHSVFSRQDGDCTLHNVLVFIVVCVWGGGSQVHLRGRVCVFLGIFWDVCVVL